MAAIRAAPKDRMNWMTSCTFALARAHSHWARFARFMVTVWLRSLRSQPPVRLRAVVPMILVAKCCLFATIAGSIRLGRVGKHDIESPADGCRRGKSIQINQQNAAQ